jgi:hypothetical protein
MKSGVFLLCSGLFVAGYAHIAARPAGPALKDAYRDAFLVGTAVNTAMESCDSCAC